MRCLLRSIVLLLLVVLPGLYLLHQALVDPRIGFLPPSWSAEWALHPVQEILHPRRGRVSQDVEFFRDFSLEEIPERLELRVRAFGRMEVRLDGLPLDPVRAPESWKRPASFDLAPHLRMGRNRLRILVANASGSPALLVESPRFLRTRGEWHAALRPGSGSGQAVAGPRRPPPRPGALQRWDGWARARWLAWLWLAGVAFVGVRSGVRRLRSPPGPDAPGFRPRRWVRIAVPTAILAATLGLNLYNAAHYPHTRTPFDWQGHTRYVEHVASAWTPPLANDGWQMYQPPLYYYAAAAVHRLSGGLWKAVQVLGCLVGTGLALLTWLQVRWLRPDDEPAQWAALGFAGFLPMCLYMNPLVSNEVFAGTATALALYGLVRAAGRPRISLASGAVLGLLAGLSLLSKFTGLFALLAGGLVMGLRALERRGRHDWGLLAVFTAVALAVCGWFYARNLLAFGDPFVGNWDRASGFHYVQEPSFRTAGFYLRFGSVFFDHPERNVSTSWLDGMVGSMWADTRRTFHADEDTAAQLGMGIAVILAALPMLAILLGLLEMLVSAVRRPVSNADLPMIAASLWTWSAIVAFSLAVPALSTIKAFFFLPLVPVLGTCLARGRSMLDPWARRLLDATLLALALLALAIYRYPSA